MAAAPLGGRGAEFAWWCTEAPEAFSGREPVYISLREEIVAMAGQQVYDLLSSYLKSRSDRRRKDNLDVGAPDGAPAPARRGQERGPSSRAVTSEAPPSRRPRAPLCLGLRGANRCPGAELADLLGLVQLLRFVEAPGGMLLLRVGPALGARLHGYFNCAL